MKKVSIILFFLIGICILLLNCHRALPKIEDPKALRDAAEKLPKIFGIKLESSILIYRRPSHMTEVNSEFITPDYKAVKISLPGEITELKPSDILMHNEIVVIQICGGGPATHRGFCIFLSDKPTKINRIVKKLKLIEIDKKYNIYEYSLYDLRMIVDKWDAEQHG